MTSYQETSQLFLAKLQLALTQSNASIATTSSCLHDISLNLGLEEGVDAFHVGRRTISLPHFQLHPAATGFQAGRVSDIHTSPSNTFSLPVLPNPWLQTPSPPLKLPVHSTPHPGISSHALHVDSVSDALRNTDSDVIVDTSPAAASNRATAAVNGRGALQNESDTVKRKLFESKTASPSKVSVDDRSPSSITPKSSAVAANRQSESPDFTPMHTHQHHDDIVSPTAVCSCVDPATVHQIKAVQQKLASLSSEMSHSLSFPETTMSGEPPLPSLSNPNDLSEPEVADAYPILPPPPGFVTQNTDETESLQGDSETGHLQLELSPISRLSCSFSYMATRSLTPQIQHISSSSTSGSAIRRENFSTHTPKALQQLHRTLKHMRLYPCSKSFQVWRKYTEKRTALRRKSVQFEERARLRKMRDIFSTWKQQSARLSHLRELEVRHHDRVDSSTLKTCLVIWKARTQRKLADREAELQAVSYHTSVCLKKYFVCWRIAYQSAIAEIATQVCTSSYKYLSRAAGLFTSFQ